MNTLTSARRCAAVVILTASIAAHAEPNAVASAKLRGVAITSFIVHGAALTGTGLAFWWRVGNPVEGLFLTGAEEDRFRRYQGGKEGVMYAVLGVAITSLVVALTTMIVSHVLEPAS